jgi:beta-1,4-N-acetylglucosaminyltransferase
MIFVTLGNVPIPFTRLAGKVDEIAGRMDEEIIIQYGYTGYPFKNVKAYKFLSSNEMERYVNNAAFIISHGGYGTLSECIKKNKKAIAVPRGQGEHNHSQEELVKALEEEGYIIGVYDINDLEAKMKSIHSFIPQPFQRGNAEKVINDFIKNTFQAG